jgi:hypothetical protein
MKEQDETPEFEAESHPTKFLRKAVAKSVTLKKEKGNKKPAMKKFGGK